MGFWLDERDLVSHKQCAGHTRDSMVTVVSTKRELLYERPWKAESKWELLVSGRSPARPKPQFVIGCRSDPRGWLLQMFDIRHLVPSQKSITKKRRR
jgi:hypothetical protein